jgi:hypothetical protein
MRDEKDEGRKEMKDEKDEGRQFLAANLLPILGALNRP